MVDRAARESFLAFCAQNRAGIRREPIAEVAIDEGARLRVVPRERTFEFIWRAAAEVNWDAEGRYLYSPKPREWSYLDWYEHIVGAVRSEYAVVLVLEPASRFAGIPAELEQEIRAFDREFAEAALG